MAGVPWSSNLLQELRHSYYTCVSTSGGFFPFICGKHFLSNKSSAKCFLSNKDLLAL